MYNFFFRHFLRSPKNVGAILPLSQSVAAQFTKHFPMRTDQTPWKILEVGAGAGNITKALIAHMQQDDHLDIVEIDEACCHLLKDKFAGNSQLSIHCMSILDWHPTVKYDLIVSTLPMNSFQPEQVANILKHYRHLGNKEAICSYSEYIGIQKLKFIFANEKHTKVMKERKQILNTFLKNHLLEKNKVFSNFLPCYIYHLKLHPSLGIKSN